jgi:hypothetical protein
MLECQVSTTNHEPNGRGGPNVLRCNGGDTLGVVQTDLSTHDVLIESIVCQQTDRVNLCRPFGDNRLLLKRNLELHSRNSRNCHLIFLRQGRTVARKVCTKYGRC